MKPQIVNLAAGDELVIGPVAGVATLSYSIESAEKIDPQVRSAIRSRDGEISRLQQRVNELEDVQEIEASRIADAILTRIAEKVS